MRHFLFLLVLTLALPVAGYAQSNKACINYWSVGPTGCDGRPEPEPQPVMPTPMPMMQKPMPVKPADPVDQFYQTYDKPPRAFVEFQLNPTPANAMAWVKEYQSIINKSSDTAEVWRQAENAYTQYQQTGELPQQFTQALSDEERQQLVNIMQSGPAAPKPMAFAAGDPASNLPQAFQDAFRGIPTSPTLAAAQRMPNAQAPAQSSANALAALNKGSLTKPADASSNNLSMAALNRGEDTAASNVIKVNYYFSAICPYCHKFEPELARVQREFKGKRLEVTCVDMTPGERIPTNKQTGINCQWRPLAPGEKDANQVRATPSLLVDFGPTKSLELVEGYVEADKLMSYLNIKAAQ